MAVAKLHGLHVDIGVFPDLRIDEAGKQEAKQPLGKAGLRQRAVLVDGFSNFLAAAKNQICGNVRHGR